MTARRVVALLIAATTALVIPSFVRANTSSQAPASQASLLLDPSSGAPDQPFSAHYVTANGQCGSGYAVQLSWDGSAWVSRGVGSRCSASWRALVPPGGATSGAHDIQAVLVDCQNGCAPVNGSQADATYTISPDPGGPTAPSPTGTAATPAATPTPTLLALAPGGTFPAHACVNGIPDSTPCPTATGAVAALATGPATPSPLPTATTSDPVSVPWSAIGFGAIVLTVLLVVVLALGWRLGKPRPPSSPAD